MLSLFSGFWSRMSSCGFKSEGGSANGSVMVDMAETLKQMMLYVFSIFVLAFEFIKRVPRRIRPVRVSSTVT